MRSHPEGRELLYLIFALSLLLSALVIYATEKTKYYNERERVSHIAAIQASKIQASISVLMQKAQTLKMLVIQGNGSIPDFENMARELIDDPSINSLQIAPGGVISQIYPPLKNQRVLTGIFDNPVRAVEARLARDTGKLTLAGPYSLEQGGLGIVGRQPVFFPDANGKDVFWGFTTIVLTLPDALVPAGLTDLAQEGLEYTLHRIRPDTHSVQYFARSSDSPLHNPVEISFQLPNTSWTLRLAPENGWLNMTSLAVEICIAIFVCILLTVLGYAFVAVQTQKVELERLSLTDALTGLFNRRKLQDFLRVRCSANREAFLLCYMDLNNFKEINDSLGHACGDQLLVECVRRFQRCLGPDDVLFRVGGDEFIAFMEGGLDARWTEKEKCLVNALNDPVSLDEHPVRTAVSIGRAVYPKDGDTGESLLRRADTRMYRSKVKQKMAGNPCLADCPAQGHCPGRENCPRNGCAQHEEARRRNASTA